MPKFGSTVERNNAVSFIELGIRILEAFPKRCPSAKELQQRFGISKATAHRWASAIKAARGTQ